MREHATPLLTALRKLTVEEQHQFANLAGTSRNYLYQLACCNRNSPGVTLAKAISEASVVMHVQTLGRSPKLSIDTLASMCPCPPEPPHSP